MVSQSHGFDNQAEADARFQMSLLDQGSWLISLRWVAVGMVVAGTLIGTRIFPVLSDPRPLYGLAGILLLCNVGYLAISRVACRHGRRCHLVLATVQMEVDLLVLTAVLHFSGGVTNPFFLFYIFHVIIATIILPRSTSFVVGMTAIVFFGLLAANELHGGAVLGHYPLQLSSGGGIWRNPVYGLGAFAAFAFTVVLAQVLTHIILSRMTAKELEAQRSNDLLRAVINAMDEGLIFVTTQGRIGFSNPAAQRWRPDGCNGRADPNQGYPERLAACIRTLAPCDKHTGPSGELVSFETGPGGRFIEVRPHPVMSHDGVPLGHVIVGQDLTEHKRLEVDLLDRTEQLTAINAMLRESRVRMAQREKMVALGQMAAGIAHEIGNPLASLSSVVQYIGRKCADPTLKEMCTGADHHVARISAILKRMLSLARPASAEHRWVDVDELIRNTLSLIRFDRRAQHVAIHDVPNRELPTVWLNPQHLEQCLINVLLNALDAMDACGARDDHRLDVTRALEDEMIEIRVRDTGIGMSPDVCRRAFESFFTTKEVGKGTGLGLFISFNLITEMDGAIELESEPGKGTTAILRIPVRPSRDLVRSRGSGEVRLNAVQVLQEHERSCY